MKELQKWIKGKPNEIALLSIGLASGAEALFEIIKAFRDSLLLKDEKLPDAAEWLKLYQDHRRVFIVFKDMAKLLGKAPKMMSEYDDRAVEILDKARPYQKSGSIPDEIKTSAKNLISEDLQELLEIAIEQAVAGISNVGDMDISDDGECPPEIMFGFAISFPCWLIYGQHSVQLLRKARQGSIENIEKLLRIDPSIILDKKVKEHFHRIMHGGKTSEKMLLIEALDKKPRKNPDLQMVKSSMAGLISIKSEKLSHRLNVPEIRSLFDALSLDQGKGLIDTDLPESPESFKKAIQRHRAFWSQVA